MTTPPFPEDLKHILAARKGNVLEVTINRPAAFNALHGEGHRELSTVFDAFEADPDLWVAIITGAGDKAFCSGNDLKVTQEGGDISTPRTGFGGLASRLDREKPIIAAVNGVAMGGGMEIALACDLIVADAHALFALPEVKVGLFAAAGGIQRLSRQIGRKQAMELILTGRHISAARAAELGIINAVASDGKSAMDRARALADEILLASPVAVRASKRVLNALDQAEGLEATLARSMTEFVPLLQTNDAKEGVAAFVAKRPPNWTNS
ncbi:MAG: enoyl-CoA hydratase-related protein [Rhodobacteraceae bacterium]|nr:enoyl-CoA hydratase-related protein [Paracoccaceae bacterium]